MSSKTLNYSKSVNYSLVDPLKILMQKEGKATAKNLDGSTFKELSQSRGESAYVLDAGDHALAFVVEGLGTKNLVADAVYKDTGISNYQKIAQDLVATIVNDLITVGARPLVLNAYWSMQSYDWFNDKPRAEDLIKGLRKACDLAGVTWGGGETQSLNEIVKPGVIELAGAGVGIVAPKSRLTVDNKLKAGDVIIILESSGIHANGVSLARDLSEKLPLKYETKLPDGKTYGEALLEPSLIYSPLVQDLYHQGIDIHYMAHITGHGWRKIMRHSSSFTYRMKKIPPVPSVLQFIQDQIGMDDEEAYATFNMGAGFALYVAKEEVNKTLMVAKTHMVKAYEGGIVEKGPKQVIIEPKKITYSEQSLQLR